MAPQVQKVEISQHVKICKAFYQKIFRVRKVFILEVGGALVCRKQIKLLFVTKSKDLKVTVSKIRAIGFTQS